MVSEDSEHQALDWVIVQLRGRTPENFKRITAPTMV